MNQKMNILIVEPGRAPRPASISATAEAVADTIGGGFDAYFLMPQQVLLLHRQNGECLRLPVNRKNPYLPGNIHGTFLLYWNAVCADWKNTV